MGGAGAEDCEEQQKGEDRRRDPACAARRVDDWAVPGAASQAEKEGGGSLRVASFGVFPTPTTTHVSPGRRRAPPRATAAVPEHAHVATPRRAAQCGTRAWPAAGMRDVVVLTRATRASPQGACFRQ